MDNFYDQAEKILIRLDDSLALFLVQMQLVGKLSSKELFYDIL
jgi:hypothetical protein